jgi:pimeloyl-ACP methyl ester carboxylesterase
LGQSTQTHRGVIAARVDETTGTREIAEFVSAEREAMFSLTHVPGSSIEACVVVCSPLYAEFIRNYRREVVIARRLSAAGIAVARFHYRGQGNSQGNSHDSTFDTMRDDTIRMAERVLEATGVRRLAFFGTRFGGLIAAAAAARFEGTPLLVWDPILDASQYLRDIYRVQKIQALRLPGREAGGADSLLDQLQRTGRVQVLGYTISRSLYESSAERTLEKELGSVPRSILLLRLGKDPRLDKGLDQLIERWTRQRFNVESRSLGQREPWWFTSGAATKLELLNQVSDETVDWLTQTLTDRGRG